MEFVFRRDIKFVIIDFWRGGEFFLKVEEFEIDGKKLRACLTVRFKISSSKSS